jgi:hypothetical protein
MIDKIRVDSGLKRIQVNDGPEFIEFNPEDIVFIEAFYNMAKEFDLRKDGYTAKFESLAVGEEGTDNPYGSEMDEKIALLREVCEFMREQIDLVFGEETSQKVFGDAMTLNMFAQFIDGINPFISPVREKKVAKYISPEKKAPTKKKATAKKKK